MASITREQLRELAEFNGVYCISIIMPTPRFGMEINEGKPQIMYNNHLRAIRLELEARELPPREIDSLLEPAEALLRDLSLWRQLSDSLVVFRDKDFFRYYTLPIEVEDFHYLADHFYLKPLVPMFSSDTRFFLLALTLHGAQLYACTWEAAESVPVEDLTPGRLEDVVGYDYEQKSLQFRSQQPGPGGTIFHGQGRAKDKRDEEVTRYCRAVDEGLQPILRTETAPMVVACVEYLFPIYQEVSAYRYLVEKPIAGAPEGIPLADLHRQARALAEPVLRADMAERIARFHDLYATSRSAYELEKIVPAALHGRIDTLFLQVGQEVFGKYFQATGELSVEADKKTANASLLNLAAVQTFLQGGLVFLLPPEEMPAPDKVANAVLRY